MGAGDDAFQWDPGDGSDTIEGPGRHRQMLFNGSNASENINIAANGGRVLFFRDVANIVMDLNDVESDRPQALGGADNIVIGDLSGTDVTQIAVDLPPARWRRRRRGRLRSPSTAPTAPTSSVAARRRRRRHRSSACRPRSTSSSPEQANDRLTVNGLGGDDVINATIAGGRRHPAHA